MLEQDSVDIAEEMDKERCIQRLSTLMWSVLNKREQDILCKRYGIGQENHYTQKQIAGQLGISRSYVSRIEKRALEKLRYALEN